MNCQTCEYLRIVQPFEFGVSIECDKQNKIDTIVKENGVAICPANRCYDYRKIAIEESTPRTQ